MAITLDPARPGCHDPVGAVARVAGPGRAVVRVAGPGRAVAG